MSFGKSDTPPLPVPPGAPAPPPLFGQDQGTSPGQKPKRQAFQPTFLGDDTRPSQGQLGSKTLLGQ